MTAILPSTNSSVFGCCCFCLAADGSGRTPSGLCGGHLPQGGRLGLSPVSIKSPVRLPPLRHSPQSPQCSLPRLRSRPKCPLGAFLHPSPISIHRFRNSHPLRPRFAFISSPFSPQSPTSPPMPPHSVPQCPHGRLPPPRPRFPSHPHPFPPHSPQCPLRLPCPSRKNAVKKNAERESVSPSAVPLSPLFTAPFSA